MTKLIALAAITVAVCAELAADIEPGTAFEVSPDAAEPLLTNGLAQLVDASLTDPAAPDSSVPAGKSRSIKVRVLVACEFGEPDDVITLSAADAKTAEAIGRVDSNKAAVAYALSLQA